MINNNDIPIDSATKIMTKEAVDNTIKKLAIGGRILQTPIGKTIQSNIISTGNAIVSKMFSFLHKDNNDELFRYAISKLVSSAPYFNDTLTILINNEYPAYSEHLSKLLILI